MAPYFLSWELDSLSCRRLAATREGRGRCSFYTRGRSERGGRRAGPGWTRSRALNTTGPLSQAPSCAPLTCQTPGGPRPIPMGPGTCGSHPDIFPPAPPSCPLPARPPRPLHLQTVPSSFLFSTSAVPRSAQASVFCLLDAPCGLLTGPQGPSLAPSSPCPRAAGKSSLRGQVHPASPL